MSSPPRVTGTADRTRTPEVAAGRAGYTVGIDVGGTKCLGVILDSDNRVVAETRVATPEGTENLVEVLAEVSGELVRIPGEVDAMGFGLPGLLDTEGRFRFAPNLGGPVEAPIADLLAERLGRQVWIDNDANCAARAELRFGAAMGVRDAVLVTLGTGIGSSVIVAGEVQRGAYGMAGELGHMTVDAHGEPCACGRRGCWECYASGSGLRRMARTAAIAESPSQILVLAGGDLENVRGEHLTRAARAGDVVAVEVLDRFAWWLALGLANVSAALDPELMILGGGLVADWDLYEEPLLRHYSDLVLGSGHRPDPAIVPAALGERAGAMGAALLARDEFAAS